MIERINIQSEVIEDSTIEDRRADIIKGYKAGSSQAKLERDLRHKYPIYGGIINAILEEECIMTHEERRNRGREPRLIKMIEQRKSKRMIRKTLHIKINAINEMIKKLGIVNYLDGRAKKQMDRYEKLKPEVIKLFTVDL